MSPGRGRSLLARGALVALSVATGVHAQPATSEAFCAVGRPDSVLRCLVRSFAERDIGTYRSLLAPDGLFVLGDEKNSWGFDREVRAHETIFANPAVKNLSLAIADGYRIAPGTEPNTWVIADVAATVTLDMDRDGTTRHSEVSSRGVELRLREVSGPVAHFVIYRWWQPATY